jgi:hypothetical protein
MMEALELDKSIDKDGNVRGERRPRIARPHRTKHSENAFHGMNVEGGSDADDVEYVDSGEDSISSFDGSDSEEGDISMDEVCLSLSICASIHSLICSCAI